jgi:hypothetical protein
MSPRWSSFSLFSCRIKTHHFDPAMTVEQTARPASSVWGMLIVPTVAARPQVKSSLPRLFTKPTALRVWCHASSCVASALVKIYIGNFSTLCNGQLKAHLKRGGGVWLKWPMGKSKPLRIRLFVLSLVDSSKSKSVPRQSKSPLKDFRFSAAAAKN